MKWYKVPGYKVEVTKDGNYVRHCLTKSLKTHYNKKKYKYVSISTDDGKRCFKGVHQLVALVFIGPCPKGKEVNHKDTVKSNNYYKNLEYLTHKKNMEHAVRNDRMVGVCKNENNGNSKLTIEQVIDIRFLYSTGLYTQLELAKLFKVVESTIWFLINNLSWLK